MTNDGLKFDRLKEIAADCDVLKFPSRYVVECKRLKEFSDDLMGHCNALRSRAQKAEAAAIDDRAQYLLWLDANPDCKAWNFDELEQAKQEEYRKQAMESLKMEEPWAIIQLREARAEAARWQAVAVAREANYIQNIHCAACRDSECEGCEYDLSREECLKQAAAALGCSPKAWLMSEERIKALEWAVHFAEEERKWSGAPIDKDIGWNPIEKTLRAMVEEAKQ